MTRRCSVLSSVPKCFAPVPNGSFFDYEFTSNYRRRKCDNQTVLTATFASRATLRTSSVRPAKRDRRSKRNAKDTTANADVCSDVFGNVSRNSRGRPRTPFARTSATEESAGGASRKKCKIRPDPITPVRSYPVRRVVRRPVGANPSVVTKPIENVTVALDPMSHV